MCRKNLNSLTTTERNAFTSAVNTLRDNGGYAIFAQIHSGAGDHGHFGPSFFAWHRRFVRDFEIALQQINPSVWLPYWDFTVENLNSLATESLIWRADFMGGPGSAADDFRVIDGPFATWNLRRNAFNIFQAPGNGGIVANAMAQPDFTFFREQVEDRPHGRAHTWTGGDVADFQFSPEDPVFFLIHCNVDRLWAEWIDRWQGTPGFVAHAPSSGAPTGHNLNDTMWPWNGTTDPFALAPWSTAPISVRPVDLLDHTTLGYRYDTLDICGLTPKAGFPKELKERAKEILPKELKERLPKELKERLPKELKERGPKEIKEVIREKGQKDSLLEKGIKERLPKEASPKEIREDVFIPRDLRPDLTDAALNFEDDLELDTLEAELAARGALARGRKGRER